VTPTGVASFGVQRGQATIEYALLATALVVAMCLLVRFETPVQWLARAVVHTIVPRPAGRPHRGGGGHHGHRQRRPHPCLCPRTVVALRVSDDTQGLT
jgi:hypothetical protein